MAQIQRKMNGYFFDAEKPAVSDQITYYGTLVAGGLMTVLTLVSIW